MFPNDLRRIVGARIFPTGDVNRIEIISTGDNLRDRLIG